MLLLWETRPWEVPIAPDEEYRMQGVRPYVQQMPQGQPLLLAACIFWETWTWFVENVRPDQTALASGVRHALNGASRSPWSLRDLQHGIIAGM